MHSQQGRDSTRFTLNTVGTLFERRNTSGTTTHRSSRINTFVSFARTSFSSERVNQSRRCEGARQADRADPPLDSPMTTQYIQLARRQLEQRLNYMVEALVNSWTGGSPSTSLKARTLSPTSTPHKKITRMPPTMMVWKLANSDNYFSSLSLSHHTRRCILVTNDALFQSTSAASANQCS